MLLVLVDGADSLGTCQLKCRVGESCGSGVFRGDPFHSWFVAPVTCPVMPGSQGVLTLTLFLYVRLYRPSDDSIR